MVALITLLVLLMFLYYGLAKLGEFFGWIKYQKTGVLVVDSYRLGYAFANQIHKFFFGGKTSGIYGTAEFMEKKEQRSFLQPANQGLSVNGTLSGRIGLEDSFAHLALIAPSGGGKTSRYIIPNILALLIQNCSILVLDPAGECMHKTGYFALNQERDLKVFNLSDTHSSLQFNPLQRANTHTEINMLANILIDSAFPDSKGDSSFWNNGGKLILYVLIRCLKNTPNNAHHNLANVRRLLNRFGSDGEGLVPFVSKYADEATLSEFQGFISQSPNVMLGQLSTAKSALEPFADPNLCQLTSADNINFESIRSKPSILYIQVAEHQVGYYSFILKILYTQMFDFFMEQEQAGLPHLPVFALLDEFGNSGALPKFSEYATSLRKRKVSLSIILQDLSQLIKTYGRENASIIINGACSSRVFYPGLSYETCKEIENILGKSTVLYDDPTKMEIAEREVGRSLKTAQEIRELPDNSAIYIYKNRKPVMLNNVVPYYENTINDMVEVTSFPFPEFLFPPLEEVQYFELDVN